MANDRTRRNLFASLRDRLLPGDVKPTNVIELDLGGMSKYEDSDGVYASYDVPLRTSENSPGKVTNRNFNRIHRMMEAFGHTLTGQREVMRAQKVQQHVSIFPSAYYSFVETFHDTKFTEDGLAETNFNGNWTAPTTNPPEDPTPPSTAAFTITGTLTHNAYEGSIFYNQNAGESAAAATYRTVDLLATGLTQGTTVDEYWLPNHFEGIATTDLYAAEAYSESSMINLLNTGVMLVVTAHANNAFWDGYWDTDDPANTAITADQVHTSKNRVVIYPWTSGAGIDISQKLNYFPHVEEDVIYAPTTTAGSDAVWGKIINVEDRRYRSNEGKAYTVGATNYPWHTQMLADVAASGTSSTVEIKHTTIADFTTNNNWSSNFPAGFINDSGVGGQLDTATYGVADALRVDVTLGPNAKLFSLGIHAIRAIDWVQASLGGKHTT